MVEKIEISKGVNLLIGDEPVKLETYGVPTNRTSYFPYLIEIGGPDGYLYYPHYYPSIEIYEKNEDFWGTCQSWTSKSPIVAGLLV